MRLLEVQKTLYLEVELDVSYWVEVWKVSPVARQPYELLQDNNGKSVHPLAEAAALTEEHMLEKYDETNA